MCKIINNSTIVISQLYLWRRLIRVRYDKILTSGRMLLRRWRRRTWRSTDVEGTFIVVVSRVGAGCQQRLPAVHRQTTRVIIEQFSTGDKGTLSREVKMGHIDSIHTIYEYKYVLNLKDTINPQILNTIKIKMNCNVNCIWYIVHSWALGCGQENGIPFYISMYFSYK